jgi:hypothetical protein
MKSLFNPTDKPDYKMEIHIKDKKILSIVYGNYFKYEQFKNNNDVDKIMKRNLKQALKMIKKGS